MKILHMADLHLDSKMETHLSQLQAKERKNEMLVTFKRCVDFGAKQGVTAILLAGDIFDKKGVKKTAVDSVKEIIALHPDITFFCLRGNHDDGDVLRKLAEGLDNIILFDEGWNSYELGDTGVVITACETGDDSGIYSKLMLPPDNINIVMLHGQIIEGNADKNPSIIPLGSLRSKNIDYLALGHIHKYSTGKIDARGVYVYPGCMESRGFDEDGTHGIVLIDINEYTGEIKHSLYSMENRSCIVVEIDVSGCNNSVEAEYRAESILSAVDEKHLVEAVLTGDIGINANIDIGYLQKAFNDKFYFLKWKDQTRLKIDPNMYVNEISIRGEFVRRVRAASELTEDEKNEIINMGIRALQGEDVSYENYKA